MLRNLFSNLQQAHQDSNVKAVVVTGANGNFSAGFDINQFQNASGGGIDNSINDSICTVLESGPKPTVAAIEGVALGGGLEVAMGCNARLCTPGKTVYMLCMWQVSIHKAAACIISQSCQHTLACQCP